MAALLAGALLVGTAQAQERPPAVVHAAEVVQKDVAAGRTFVGTVEAERSSVIGCEVEGQVIELSVREGVRVEKGAVLAKLRTRQVELALAETQAALASRQSQLEELENGSRPEDIEQADARLAAATADRVYADWQLESTRKLFAEKKVSEGALQQARAAAARAVADEKQARSALALMKAGPRAERIDEARAQVGAARARMARLSDQLERAVIKAPFTGYVVARHTEAGQWLGIGDPVVEIAALDRVEIHVPVLEDYVGGLRPGSEAQVIVTAAGGGPRVGQVARIVPKGDRSTRTFPVKVLVDNPEVDGRLPLKAGMFARVTLSVGKVEQGLLVPKDALVLGGRSPIVYMVVPGKDGKPATVAPIPVELGVASGGMIQIRADIPPGAQVVTRGNERLMPGQSVQVVGAKSTGGE